MVLRISNISKKVLDAQYAVRGQIALRAEQIRAELAKDSSSHPIAKVTNLNIGNPQQLDQKPVTFFRQVLSLVEYPELLKNPPKVYKNDAIQRAKFLLSSIGSVGAYSTSNGPPVIRESIAKFIERRDGFPANPDSIFTLTGASAGVQRLIQLLTTSEKTGVLIPIPQYPLYSATLTLNGASPISYYLDESQGWKTTAKSIEEKIVAAKNDGLNPSLLVVINPGNPTGSVLTPQDIKEILQVAQRHDLAVLADEVYQTNIFNEKEFVSFKKVRSEMLLSDPEIENVPLCSVHSTSKGFVGECGQRGGYMELVGFPQEFLDQVYKLASVELCPPVGGQILTELMVNPPKPEDESYDQYKAESNSILETLYSRAMNLYNAFVKMPGVECQPPQGAMYLFPRIEMPKKAIEAAALKGVAADEMYAMDLLNETGICVVPGSGFGQVPNTYHFRTTFLAPGGPDLSDKFVNFHRRFMEKYA